MAYTYRNSEGQTFESDEIIDALEGEARWSRTDDDGITVRTVAPDYSGDPGVLTPGLVSPRIGGETGAEVSGGPHHLTSTTAGGFPPHEVLSTDQAVERAQAQLDALLEKQATEADAREKAETTAREAAELERERQAQAALEESARLGATADAARTAGETVGTDAQVTVPEIDDAKEVFPDGGKPALPEAPKGNASTPDWANYARAIGVTELPDEAGRQDIQDAIEDFKEEHPDWADRFASDVADDDSSADNSTTTEPAQGEGEPNGAPAKP